MTIIGGQGWNRLGGIQALVHTNKRPLQQILVEMGACDMSALHPPKNKIK
jgi:hypothetical protein